MLGHDYAERKARLICWCTMGSARRVARRVFCRRSLSGMLLAAFSVTAAGVPMPARSVPDNSDELYPCAASACGCKSAERCWRSCCCHSLAERFVWARKYNVRPPAFAIAEGRRAGLDLAWLDRDSRDALCVKPAACCAKKIAVAKGAHSSCCSEQKDQPANDKVSHHVIGWRALECQGHSAGWVAAVPTLVVTGCDLADDLSVVDWLGPALSERAFHSFDLPAIPPPKAV